MCNRVVYVVIFMFSCLVGRSQTSTIKNLIFEGAGMKGLAYAGAIAELEEQNLLKDIEKVGGTSAGAITALLVSIGYTSDEICTLISSTDFSDFNDGQYIFVGGISRMNNRYGWYKGDSFTKWLADLIEAKTKNENITFAQLSEQGFIDLYITATCLNKQKLFVFSKESYPDMKIKDAVRISISIPLYYQAIFIDSIGNVYEKDDESINLDIVMDGGIIGNYPIFIFDTIKIVNGEEVRIPNYHTIGFRMDTDRQIQQDTTSRELAPYEISSFVDYITAFYTFTIENLNRNKLTTDDWARTVSIS